MIEEILSCSRGDFFRSAYGGEANVSDHASAQEAVSLVMARVPGSEKIAVHPDPQIGWRSVIAYYHLKESQSVVQVDLDIGTHIKAIGSKEQVGKAYEEIKTAYESKPAS